MYSLPRAGSSFSLRPVIMSGIGRVSSIGFGGEPLARDRIYGLVSDSPDLGAALAMGLGGGLRAFAPAVALAVHGHGPFAGRARFIAFGAAVVELIADKNPSTPSRWSSRGMSPRLAFSATGGRVLGGGPGAAIAAAAALGAAFVGSRLRVKVHGRGRQLVAATAEDALSYSLVLIATSSLHEGPKMVMASAAEVALTRTLCGTELRQPCALT
jgi:uncharacterized membrane protein